MKIIKKINNNVALAQDAKGKELVVFAKGVGFPPMPYELNDLSEVQRTFYDVSGRYIDLLRDLPEDLLLAADDIVKEALEELDCELNPNLPFILADHLQFAIQRCRDGVPLQNPLSYDVRHLYPKEYTVACRGISILREELGVELPDSEAIIIAVAVGCKLEKWLRQVIPDVIKLFIVPFVTLVIMVPLTYLVIGPIASILCNILTVIFSAIYSLPVVGGIIAGLLIGAFWQVLVIFGLHWSLIPLSLINYSTLGYDFILSPYFCVSFAQTFVVLAIILKTRDEKLKKIAIPAFISGIFGVTEPAIYGVTLPKKKPFIYSCIGGAIGGAFIGMMGVRSYSMGGLGLFGLPSYIDVTGTTGIQSLINVVIGTIIASVIGFVLTWFLYKDDAPAK